MATNATKDTPPPSSKDDKGAQRDFFRKKRTYEKIQITKKITKMEELLAHDPLTSNERSRLSKLDEEVKVRMKTLYDLQEQVIMFGSEDPEKDDEISYLDSYEETVEDLHNRVLECLKPYKRKTHSSSSSSDSEEDDDESRRKHKEPKHRYSVEAMNFDSRKKIKEPFSGKDPLKYKTFKTCFQSLDRKMDDMGFTEAEKLIELKKCLEGDALGFIERLPDDDENYKAAIEILDGIYFNNAKFAEKIIMTLINTPKMSNTTDSIKNTYQAIMAADQTLTGLNISPEQLGQILFVVICESKLNNQILRQWSAEKSKKKNPDHPMGHNATKKDLMNLLRDAFVLSGDIDRNSSNKGHSNEEQKQQNQGKRHHGSFGTQKTDKKDDQKQNQTQESCAFCKKRGHKIAICTTLKNMSIKERWDYVKEKRLCCLCFSKDHRADSCKFRPCDINGCQRKHSRWLHMEKEEKKVHGAHTTQNKTDNKKDESHTSMAAKSQVSKNSLSPVAILQSCMAWAISPSGEKLESFWIVGQRSAS